MRRSSRRRPRRPSRKRNAVKRIKKVIDSLAEKHYHICPDFVFTSPTLTHTPSVSVLDAERGVYNFNYNYPAMGFLQLNNAVDMPQHSNEKPDGYSGKRVDLTGYSITGTIVASPAALSNGFARIHLVKMNTNKMTPATTAGRPNGSSTRYPDWFLNSRSGYVIPTASPTPNHTSLALDSSIDKAEINMFDTNLGDRHGDTPLNRVGWFNHGFKLHHGFTIVKTVTLDRRVTPHPSQLSKAVVPFTMFVPQKKTFRDLAVDALGDDATLDTTVGQRRTEMAEQMPIMFLLVELCQLEIADAVASGFNVSIHPPRLHFKDYA
jgi:hypothetical protein